MLIAVSKRENKKKFIQMRKHLGAGENLKAMEVAKTIEFVEDESAFDISLVATAYEENGKLDTALTYYENSYRKSANTAILLKLINLCIELNQVAAASDYLDEYGEEVGRDFDFFVCQYKIDKLFGNSDKVLINDLESIKNSDFDDEFGYELASMYYKAGRRSECVKLCNEIILWFAGTVSAKKAEALKSLEEGTMDDPENDDEMHELANMVREILDKEQNTDKLASETEYPDFESQKLSIQESKISESDVQNIQKPETETEESGDGEYKEEPVRGQMAFAFASDAQGEDSENLEEYDGFEDGEDSEDDGDSEKGNNSEELADGDDIQDSGLEKEFTYENPEKKKKGLKKSIGKLGNIISGGIGKIKGINVKKHIHFAIVDDEAPEDREENDLKETLDVGEKTSDAGKEMAKVKKNPKFKEKTGLREATKSREETTSGEAIKSREETKSREKTKSREETKSGEETRSREENRLKKKINSEKKDETVDNMPDDGPENENMSGLSEKENELGEKGNADNEEPDYKEDYDDIENDLPPVEVDCYKYPEKFDRCFFNPERPVGIFLHDNEKSEADYFGDLLISEKERIQLENVLNRLFDSQLPNKNMVIAGDDITESVSYAKAVARLLFDAGLVKQAKVAFISAEKLEKLQLVSKKERLCGSILIITINNMISAEIVDNIAAFCTSCGKDTPVFILSSNYIINKLVQENTSFSSLFDNRIMIHEHKENDYINMFYYKMKLNYYDVEKKAAEMAETRLKNIIKQAGDSKTSIYKASSAFGDSVVKKAEERGRNILMSSSKEGVSRTLISVIITEDIK